MKSAVEEAVSAFESAKEIYVRGAHPARWADVQQCLGRAYESMGDRDPRYAKDHYRRALREVEHALKVPPGEQGQDRFENARSLRDQLVAKLTA